ncbi:MAG: DUF4928 domain-containing protein [Syntrophobacterales bacterium GWC2_56_13]|nr:MAG: DUF4928 domain-containing protein [Syntrophobacterales bacterium GWC2_56_13]
MIQFESPLKAFSARYRINGKGPFALVLFMTRNASKQTPPLLADHFLTPQGGQVAGLGRSAVQAILADHGITRILAEGGGRTSQGSIQKMRVYVDFLNELAQKNLLDFSAIENWWIERVREYFRSHPLELKRESFRSKPFGLKVDPSKSIRSIVADLIEAAFSRQRECPGVMVAGAVMQHLVGAKIKTALPDVKVAHKGFSVADAPGGRKGDFLIGDTAIHVTTAPTEALIRKCCDNLAQSLRPLVITTQSGVGGAIALAKNANVAERIDILEIVQFVATNVYEWCAFQQIKRSVTVRQLMETYNRIIDQCETDPSLRITMG